MDYIQDPSHQKIAEGPLHRFTIECTWLVLEKWKLDEG
jgi:hypothetical protein